jgi:hypothetical protein
MRRYRSVSGGFDESPEGGWVRYSDVQKLRENMMTMAEFQQELGDARGFRRGVRVGLAHCGEAMDVVTALVKSDRMRA